VFSEQDMLPPAGSPLLLLLLVLTVTRADHDPAHALDKSRPSLLSVSPSRAGYLRDSHSPADHSRYYCSPSVCVHVLLLLLPEMMVSA